MNKEIKDKIVSNVINKYAERSEVGIYKYNTTLENNNKDNFLNHLQEELMDSTLYIEKLKSIENFENINYKVIEWAKNKQLIPCENSTKQLLKIVKEVGEMIQSYLKNNIENTELEIGDVLVTLSIFCNQNNYNIVECYNKAYSKIKDSGRNYQRNFYKGLKTLKPP